MSFEGANINTPPQPPVQETLPPKAPEVKTPDFSKMNYYDRLGVKRGASDDEIKQAFYKLAPEYHSDTGGNEEAFKYISEAYTGIKDQEARNKYNKNLESQTTETNTPDYAMNRNVNFENEVIGQFQHPGTLLTYLTSVPAFKLEMIKSNQYLRNELSKIIKEKILPGYDLNNPETPKIIAVFKAVCKYLNIET